MEDLLIIFYLLLYFSIFSLGMSLTNILFHYRLIRLFVRSSVNGNFVNHLLIV